ncbi:MAG: hypothetical protein O3C67_08910 [Cyanobacteria bacterium]|nr:hypothetical protein [Cyanobacteriota bacterium]
MTSEYFAGVYIPPQLAGRYSRKDGNSGKLLARMLAERIAVEVHIGHGKDGAVLLRLYPALGVTLDQIISAAGVPRGSTCTLCRLGID